MTFLKTSGFLNQLFLLHFHCALQPSSCTQVPPKSNLIFETTPSPNVKKAAKDFESMETEVSD